MTSEKPIPCSDCQTETDNIQSSGLFCVISCEPIEEGSDICVIKWKLCEEDEPN